MKYIEHVNQCIRTAVAEQEKAVVFGQNVSAGSCLGGLTRGIQSTDAVHVINTPNIENSLVGCGYGMMINGVSSVFFMKQQDFLLLGIDHLVNTYNFIRQSPAKASFTVVTIIVDVGYQGMQSSLNNFGDFCSIANIQGYAVTNKHDTEHIMQHHLFQNGFRIIGVSQRLFNEELLEFDNPEVYGADRSVFRLARGGDATIICFNFSVPQGEQLRRDLQSLGIRCSLYGVAATIPTDWDAILADIKTTKQAIVIEDSKSVHCCSHLFICALKRTIPVATVIHLRRELDDEHLRPSSHAFRIDAESIRIQLQSSK